MTAKSRTLLGIALFVPLAAVLLATFACLPVPIGDPETAKIDPAITGAYAAVNPGDNESAYALIQPWDSHTYLMQYVDISKKNGKDVAQQSHFKAWLVKYGDATLICCQPMDSLQFAFGEVAAEKPIWVVLRLEKTTAGIDARMVNPDSDLLKGLTKKEDFEGAIKAHVDDKALYGDNPISFKRLGKEEMSALVEKLAKVGYNDVSSNK